MKQVVLCFRSPDKGEYVGGVMSLVNCYLRHVQLFKENGIAIGLFDYHISHKMKKLPSRISNLIYVPLQRVAFSKYIQNHNVDIVNIHTSREFLFLKDVYLAKYLSKHFKVKTILTIHVGDIRTVFNRIKPWQKKIISILNQYVDRIVFLTNGIKNQFIDIGLLEQKGLVLYNFFDFDGHHFKPKNDSALLKLLYVGAIHHEKGVLELLYAVRNLSRQRYNIHLDICGQITDPNIEKEVNEIINAMPNVFTINGYVEGDKKIRLFEQSDILILPSYHEGLPLVVLEALAAGCAIISTPVGGIPEILNDENVEWVGVGASNDIEEAKKRFVNNKSALKEMQNNNGKLSETYSMNNHFIALCNLYNEI